MKLSKEKIGFGLAALMALFLIGMSGIGKLVGSEEVVAIFNNGGINDWRVIIGIGEIVSALLFVIPITRKIGLWFLSAFFGGAIMFHMTMDESIIAPTLFFNWSLGNLYTKRC